MELGTPPRTAIAVIQPLAETTVRIFDSRGALAKVMKTEADGARFEKMAADYRNELDAARESKVSSK